MGTSFRRVHGDLGFHFHLLLPSCFVYFHNVLSTCLYRSVLYHLNFMDDRQRSKKSKSVHGLQKENGKVQIRGGRGGVTTNEILQLKTPKSTSPTDLCQPHLVTRRTSSRQMYYELYRRPLTRKGSRYDRIPSGMWRGHKHRGSIKRQIIPYR